MADDALPPDVQAELDAIAAAAAALKKRELTMLLRAVQSSVVSAFAGVGIPAPLALASFRVEAAAGGDIGEQTEGVAFNIKITALDQAGNTLTSFDGGANTVEITSDGSLSAGGGTTAAFVNGVLASHAVTFSAGWEAAEITAADTATGLKTGVSNSFQVLVGEVGTWPNEPAGFVQITDRNFSALTASGWSTFPAGDADFTIATDGAAPISPSNVGRARFPTGMGGGSGPINVYASFTANTLFIGMPIKWSSNWQNHSSGVNKVLHLWINGLNRGVFIGRGNTLVAVMACQQLAAAYSGGASVNPRVVGSGSTSVHLLPNLVSDAEAAMTRDVWHEMEMKLVGNTPGVANGEMHWWKKSAGGSRIKIGEYVGIMFAAGGGTGHWSQNSWNPTWGGTGGTVSSEMSQVIDHIYMSESP